MEQVLALSALIVASYTSWRFVDALDRSAERGWSRTIAGLGLFVTVLAFVLIARMVPISLT